VNTDPETVEKGLRKKTMVKTRKKKAVITKTDDEDGGTAEQTHKGKKKRASIPGKSASTFFTYFFNVKGILQTVPAVRTVQSCRRRRSLKRGATLTLVSRLSHY